MLATKKLEWAIGWGSPSRHHTHIPLPRRPPLYRHGMAVRREALRTLHRPSNGRGGRNPRHFVLGRSEGANLFAVVLVAAVLRAGGDGRHDGGGEAIGDADGELDGVLKSISIRAKSNDTCSQCHRAWCCELRTKVNGVSAAHSSTGVCTPSDHLDELR